MMPSSLRYRIVVVIFCLEAIVMSGVLWWTMSGTLKENKRLLDVNDTVLIDLIAGFSRVALFTGEYDDLQPYLEQVVDDPHILSVLLIAPNDTIVASSDVAEIGKTKPVFANTPVTFWRQKEIRNASGSLGTLAIKLSHAEMLAANRRVLDQGVVIALTGMLAVAVVGFISGYFLTRRLERLTGAAQQMAEGNLVVSANLQGNDEIALLGRAFDKMGEAIRSMITDLRNKQEQLRSAHDDLEEKVAERTAELAVARDQAMDASRAKGSFIANMSHELRTPLNAVIGYSEMLMEDAEDEGATDRRTELNKIHQAAIHLLSLINDILDLSKIEAGKMELHLDTFDVGIMLDDVITNARPTVENNKNKMILEKANTLGVMFSDQMKIRQTLINLVSNAGKFTEEGSVTLRARRQREGRTDWMYFEVEDTGIGIAPEHLGRLFREFSQVDDSSTRRYGGTGLGLAISKQLCQMMGGGITVSSEVGKGSKFSVKIPCEVPRAETVADQARPSPAAVS